MALTGLDPNATRILAGSMQQVASESDGIVGNVTALLTLADLESDVPRQLTEESIELEKIGLVLHARADLVEGFDINIDVLADQLGVPPAQITAAVTTLTAEGYDGSTDPLLTLVADQHYLFENPPDSIRQALIGLPPEGQDPELDAAIDRVGDLLLQSLLDDVRLDHDDLSSRQRADMKLIAIALGGDTLTEPRRKVENVRVGQGDYEKQTTIVHYTIIECGDDDILDFVQTRMEQDAGRRKATNQLLDATSQIDRNNLEAEAERLGVTTEELTVVLATADFVAAENNGTARSTGGINGIDGAATDQGDSFPDRNDFPDGLEGDRDYVNAVEQDRLDQVNSGVNIVGPVGKEQKAFYEAMGSLFGAQNLAFSHDYQATVAEMINRNDPGFLGVDLPNAVTATIGYAAAVVTAPVFGAINSVFGTNIDVAVVGVAIADLAWSAFGYDVHAPTIAASQAAREEKEKQEQAMRDLQDRAEKEAKQRDRDGNNDGRYDSRDDDYDGDGESDATDNTDDSGDPSGGHDGGV